MSLSAIVLAGTHQWSGSTFERLAPRPLLPVALDPLISYSLRWLREGGIRLATICANGTTRSIQDALGDGDQEAMGLRYYRDGSPRGAAGCVRDAGLLTDSDTLVVTDGTAIPTVNLAELLSSHEASGAALTAVVHRAAPGAQPSPGGVYVFARRVFDLVPGSGFQDIKENLIPRLHRSGERVVAHESAGFSPHVFDARTYLQVNQWMLQRLCHESADGRLVHPDAQVEAGARLVGPVQLGARARVEEGATVVGPTSIGADSTVGRNALVARSAVWTGCAIGEGAVVHGCVVGRGSVVPPAARFFNVVRGPGAEPGRPAPARGAAAGPARPLD